MRHQPRHAVNPREHARDLVARQHHGQPLRPPGRSIATEPRQVDAQHLAVEKEERAHRLILRGGCDAALGRQVVRKASTSAARHSGCRLPWKMMKRLIQSQYACSVRRL